MSELIERATDEGVGSEEFANVEDALEKFPMRIRGECRPSYAGDVSLLLKVLNEGLAGVHHGIARSRDLLETIFEQVDLSGRLSQLMSTRHTHLYVCRRARTFPEATYR